MKLDWSVSPQVVVPKQSAGWAVNPVPPQPVSDSRTGWVAWQYTNAVANLLGITPQSLLAVIAQANQIDLSNILPKTTLDYMWLDNVLAISNLLGIQPDLSNFVVSQALSDSIGITQGSFSAPLSSAISSLPDNISPTAALIALLLAQTAGFDGVNWGDPLPDIPGLLPSLANSVVAQALSNTVAITASAANAYTYVAPVTTPYVSAGTYTYTIPYWCTWLDIIVIGGGGGGGGAGTILDGNGGKAGTFGWAQITRGSQIPIALSTLSVTVGAGGAGGTGSVFISGAGSSGGASSVLASGTTLATGGGGSGGAGGAGQGRQGNAVSSGNTNSGKDINFIGLDGTQTVYAGGAASTGDTANVPGSGGRGGGIVAGRGKTGGVGQVWIRAYM